jgi:predicted acyl esterase
MTRRLRAANRPGKFVQSTKTGGNGLAARLGMLMERNTAIPMRDGAVLRGDVFRPKADGTFPMLMTFSPYGKDVPLREFIQEAWDAIEKFYPDIRSGR